MDSLITNLGMSSEPAQTMQMNTQLIHLSRVRVKGKGHKCLDWKSNLHLKASLAERLSIRLGNLDFSLS